MSWGAKGNGNKGKQAQRYQGGKGGGGFYGGQSWEQQAYGLPQQQVQVLKELRSLNKWLGKGSQQSQQSTKNGPQKESGWDCTQCGADHHNHNLTRCRKCRHPRDKPHDVRPQTTPKIDTWATSGKEKGKGEASGTNVAPKGFTPLSAEKSFQASVENLGVSANGESAMSVDSGTPATQHQEAKDALDKARAAHREIAKMLGEDSPSAQLLKKQVEDLELQHAPLKLTKCSVQLQQQILRFKRTPSRWRRSMAS